MVGVKTSKKAAALIRIFASMLLLAPASVRAESSTTASPCTEVASAAQQAARLKELPLRKPINCLEVDKSRFQNLVREELAKDNPPARLRYEAIAARMLGTIPYEYDYQRCIASDYGGDVLAFYHPDRAAIVFPNWVTTPRDVLIHEAVHALQDQYFNLSKLRDAANTASDRALALSALAEGDAAQIQDQYNKSLGSQALEGLEAEAITPPIAGCGLPELLRRQFEFPYDYGIFFVEYLRTHGGSRAINAAFRNPPRTTREILYPREFLATVKLAPSPLKLTLPPKAEKGRIVYEEIMGEYFVRSFLRAFVSPEDGIRAAKGWRSDKVRLFESSAQHRNILFWDSVWENSTEAKQFRVAMSRALGKIFGVHLNSNASYVRFATSRYAMITLRQQGKYVSYSVAEELPRVLSPAFNHLN